MKIRNGIIGLLVAFLSFTELGCYFPIKAYPPIKHYPAPTPEPRVQASRDMRKEYLSATFKALKQGLNEADVQLVQDSIKILFPKNVMFQTGKMELHPSIEPALYRFAKLLGRFDKTNILVLGHTDNQGDPQRNLILSTNRASTVRNRLIGLNVVPKRLNSWGLGDQAPIASNDTEEGRAINRCVEFVVMVNF